MVLGTHKLGEADRIITLLTRRHGKVRAVAKGVRRTRSKFGARLEPCSHVDVLLVEGRSLDVVSQAVTLNAFTQSMTDDYQLYTTGQVMVETADRLVAAEGQPALRQFLLLVGGLRTLTAGTVDGPRPASMILDSYLLRALSIAGYAPNLTCCSHCDERGPHEAFSAALGGMVCRRCRPPGSPVPFHDTWPYLQALACGDWPATRTVSPMVRDQAGELIAGFATWHMERGLRSIAMLDRSEVQPAGCQPGWHTRPDASDGKLSRSPVMESTVDPNRTVHT